MSIRARLLWLTGLAVLVPALLGLARFVQVRDATIVEDTNRLVQMAQAQAKTIRERTQGTAQLLYGLARAQDLQPGSSRQACSAFLTQVREAYPQYTGIITISPEGRLHCDSLRSGRELDLSDRLYFKAAQKAPGGIVLEPTFGRITGLPVLQLAQPVRTGQGELMFVLVASLNLHKVVHNERPAVHGALHLQLQQSQRMEAVGQLTGGIAHDFNNLLTVVMGNAELLTEQHHNQPDLRVLSEMISHAAQRGAELTQRLLAFARKQALDPLPVDVNRLLSSLDALLRRTLGEHIEIELVCGAGLWPALVDQGQLENALLNLCLNARDAMAGGGRLTLETSNTRLDDDDASRHPDVLPGPYVMLAVSDTGQGIQPAHLQRVFEPFFSTKEKCKGTGLGLSMVYGFIKQSAGHVSIYSEPGHGTTVKQYLPRAQSAGAPPVASGAVRTAATAAAAATTAATTAAGGHELILLVEDEEAVRQYALAALQSFGYQVVVASDGPSAMAVLQQRSDIDLLFTDVVMPGGMDGRVLADAARRLRPALRVLYTSGYTENAIVHHGRLNNGAPLLGKPYRRSDLGRAVRQALAAAVGAGP